MENFSINPKKGAARLWQIAFTQRLLILSSCFFAITGVIFTFCPFIAIYFIIKELLFYMANNESLNTVLLIQYGWYAGGSAILAVIFNFFALACSHIAAFRILYQLKLFFIKHLSTLSLGFHDSHSTGELRKVIDDNIEKLELFIAHQLPDLVGSFATPLMLVILVLFFDWRLGLATLLPVILSYYVMSRGYGQKGSAELFKEFHREMENMNNVSVEYVRGMAVIKAFNQTFFSFRKFFSAAKSYTDYCLAITNRFETYMGLFLLLLNNAYVFLLPVIIWLSGSAINYFEYAVAVIFYLIFTFSIAGPFLKLMYVSNLMKQIVVGVEHLDSFLQYKPLPQSENHNTTNQYDIHLQNVSFAYRNQQDEIIPALENVSFTAPEGKVTALVGISGSGKSTIGHLIPRFFDINKGVIKIGEVDIRDMDNEYLQSLVSFVFQDVFLFKQSILDNLRIGNPTATMDQVIAAAKATQCHEFIQALPQGYDTVIGTKGIHLSGGERQRLIFARAIIKDSPILILDEATSFADPQNEYKIQQAMTELMKGRTTIVIAHRLSSIVNADQIIVLDKGQIVESGKHEGLLQQNGYYSKMWQWYSRTLEWQIKS